MRYLKSLALAGLLAAAASPFYDSARAQLPALPADAQATSTALGDVAAQQKTISDNQAKMDEKLAAIAEDIRVARLFAARAK